MARPVLLLHLHDHPRGTRRYSTWCTAAKPNQIWQVGHTLLDLWVIILSGRLGRPWLTLIEDDHSRAVAGYADNLDAPSGLTIASALRQVIWRKPWPDWHVCGIPDAFHFDHGSDLTSVHLGHRNQP